jgi:hypothetical protein
LLAPENLIRLPKLFFGKRQNEKKNTPRVNSIKYWRKTNTQTESFILWSFASDEKIDYKGIKYICLDIRNDGMKNREKKSKIERAIQVLDKLIEINWFVFGFYFCPAFMFHVVVYVCTFTASLFLPLNVYSTKNTLPHSHTHRAMSKLVEIIYVLIEKVFMKIFNFAN